MRLPVEWVTLKDVEPDQFFETAGPLYGIRYTGPILKQSTFDAIVEKFVPIDDGHFNVKQSISDEQVRKLLEKCAMANKTVDIWVLLEDSKQILDSMYQSDYLNYYYEIIEQARARLGDKEKDKLEFVMFQCEEWIGWRWSEPSRLPSS
uniref:Sensory transduction histidine kinase n=1 Tax=Steinernema glaseri TaxID=37863 RepID=A0A1I7ZMD4_9BILA